MRDYFNESVDGFMAPPNLESDSTTDRDTSLQNLNAIGAPHMNAHLNPSQVLSLQRSIGNAATGRYLQRKIQLQNPQLVGHQVGSMPTATSSAPISILQRAGEAAPAKPKPKTPREQEQAKLEDRKSTRLNSSH